MSSCRSCDEDISFVRRRDSDRWIPVEAAYDVMAPLPGEVVALFIDGEWREIDVAAVRVHTPHTCAARVRGTVRRRRVGEVDDEPVEAPPELIECDECGGEHVEGGPHRMCDCGRYPTVSLGACAICLDSLSPDPVRYPNGQLASSCPQCGAAPQRPCMTKGGFPAAQPHAGRPRPILWLPPEVIAPWPITTHEIEEARRMNRAAVSQMRAWLWDHSDVLTGDA